MVNETVSHYRIIERLGGGGMGVVYRAEDLKLGRQVALKFLPDEMAADAIALERFEREAHTAAAINHPNICTLYEFGEHGGHPFLVMELLEGVSMKERIGGKPVPLDLLLTWAIQMTDGLDAAHQRGVVHRDIKPANLFLVNHGQQIKILDFGLAKPKRAGKSITAAPVDRTATLAVDLLTTPGTAAGTPGYMSPEQARGDELDVRTDLFSLGVVLYEMATGRMPFEGKTSAVVMAAILHQAPDPPSHVNAALPPALEQIVLKALEKDPDIRYQSAADMRADLKRLKRDTDSGRTTVVTGLHTAAPSRVASSKSYWLRIAAVVAAAAVVVSVLVSSRPASPLRVLRTVQITEDRRVANAPLITDGARVYFTSTAADGNDELWQVSAHGGQSLPLPGLARNEFVMDLSPDRSELLAVRESGPYAPRELWAQQLLGGSPRRFGNVTAAGGGAWAPDGRQLVYADHGELGVVKNDGTSPRRIATFPTSVYLPRWSPDGRIIRFSVNGMAAPDTIWEVNPDGSDLHRVFPDLREPHCCGVWTSDGKQFVFSVAGGDTVNVWARTEKSGFLRRTSRDLVQLTTGPINLQYPMPSPDGKHIYVVGSQERDELVILNKVTLQFLPYLDGVSGQDVSFTRDDKSAVWVAYPEGTIWRGSVNGSDRLQLTFPPIQARMPRWSPDGKQIAFFGGPPEQRRVYLMPADGGTPQPITNGEAGGAGDADPSWSPDGKSIVFGEEPPTGVAASKPDSPLLHVIDLQTHQISVLPGSEGMWSPRWSPDGRWIAGLSRKDWKLWLYDVSTHRQSQLTEIPAGYPAWSHDGEWVHFVRTLGSRTWYRIRVRDHKLEPLYSGKEEQHLIRSRDTWTGLAPDDCILTLRDAGTREIYALEWDAR